jgi:hypothetical protein
MLRVTRFRFVIATLICCGAIANAQQQTSAANSPTAKIPIRQLSAPDAITRDTLRYVSALKHLSDGRVMVNEMSRRRLVIFDPSLRLFEVVADSSGKPAAYPGGMPPFQAPMFDYLGDSVLVLDWNSQAFILVEPSGRIGRAIAHPSPRDISNILGSGFPAVAAFDAKGRLVYRGSGTSPFGGRGATASAPAPRSRDTIAIIRADFDTRTVDTVARLSLPFFALPVTTRDERGGTSARMTINPLPIPGEEWVVTSDGSIAVVKPGDYHVDWISLDGARMSTPKMPFDWRRLTEDDKQARIDSVKHIIDSLTRNGGRPPNMRVSMRPGTRVMDTVYATVDYPPLSEMPDYYPPFRPSTARADRDNNIWIPPTTTFAQTLGGVVYDVINRKGEIFERVVIPGGRIIAGFGPNGVVYLLNGNANTGFVLERRHILRAGS